MRTTVYHKLVRDRIPEIIENSGKTCSTSILSESEYIKMLDEKLVLEGLFDVVIYCKDKKFYTQGNGTSTAKTPMGMFDQVEIPNDLKLVDTAIRQYYG